MKQTQLLEKALDEFKKEYGKTHKEYGYSNVLQWKKSVLFAANPKEISAYIKIKRMIKTFRYSAIVFAVLIAIGIFAYNYTRTALMEYTFLFCTTLIVIFCICFYIHGFRLFRRYESICRGKVIIYTE